jgi:hypothetical protein
MIFILMNTWHNRSMEQEADIGSPWCTYITTLLRNLTMQEDLEVLLQGSKGG